MISVPTGIIRQTCLGKKHACNTHRKSYAGLNCSVGTLQTARHISCCWALTFVAHPLYPHQLFGYWFGKLVQACKGYCTSNAIADSQHLEVECNIHVHMREAAVGWCNSSCWDFFTRSPCVHQLQIWPSSGWPWHGSRQQQQHAHACK